MGMLRNSYPILVGQPEGKRNFGKILKRLLNEVELMG
jgi:hypothetical protein